MSNIRFGMVLFVLLAACSGDETTTSDFAGSYAASRVVTQTKCGSDVQSEPQTGAMQITASADTDEYEINVSNALAGCRVRLQQRGDSDQLHEREGLVQTCDVENDVATLVGATIKPAANDSLDLSMSFSLGSGCFLTFLGPLTR
ncbi:MAG TPA: hypothetical protein VGM39_24460 [Kofleriaceae bacterium]|jgi:hypothetical protein